MQAVLERNLELINSYPENIQNIRSVIRDDVCKIRGLKPQHPFLVNGHQVLFFHPGIFSKEVLASKAAQALQGSAISIVLDHDPHDLIFMYPEIYSDPENKNSLRIRKKSLFLRPLDRTNPLNSPISNSDLPDLLDKIADNLKKDFSADSLNFLTENFSIIRDKLEKKQSIQEIITGSRMEIIERYLGKIYPIKVSELVGLRGWKEFCKIICSDIAAFSRAHNESLEEYRKSHGIRNHAQPVPNLKPDELPFWTYGQDQNRKKAAPEDADKILYPRAITLSIFLRLFFSDVFIHGTGGARYDQVTNSIIKKFFKINAPAFWVKTATLKLPILGNSPLNRLYHLESLHQWKKRNRDFFYHPEKHPQAKQELVEKRQELIEQFKKAKEGKKALHIELEENRKKLLLLLNEEEVNIRNDLNKIKTYTADLNSLTDRNYPYFFYGIQELLQDSHYETAL